MNLTVGTKIYYRGDMANPEGFGKITKVFPAGKYSPQEAEVTLQDGRKPVVPLMMIKFQDTGDGRTRFCTEWAYRKRRKQRIDEYKREVEGLHS